MTNPMGIAGALITTDAVELSVPTTDAVEMNIFQARKAMQTGEGMPPMESTFSINPSKPIEVKEAFTPAQLFEARDTLQTWLKQAIGWGVPPQMDQREVRAVAAAFAALKAFLTDGQLEIVGGDETLIDKITE